MKLTILLFGMTLLFGACTDINKSSHLAKIDRLSKSVDSISKVLSENKIDSSFEKCEKARGIELRFKSYYTDKTVEQNLANDVNEMKAARKILGKIGKEQSNIEKGCTEMKESLRLLRYDIENADGDRKKYNEYITHEESKFTVLKTLCNEFVGRSNRASTTFANLYDELNAYSMNLVERAKGKGAITSLN